MTLEDIKQYWGLLVADFRREYHMDLFKEAWSITAEHLFLLIGGLSSDSRFVSVIAQKKPNASHRSQKPTEVKNFGEFMAASTARGD